MITNIWVLCIEEKKMFSIQLHNIKKNSLKTNLRDIEIKINQNICNKHSEIHIQVQLQLYIHYIK